MIGLLLVGFLGSYALVYSGLSEISGTYKVSTIQALGLDKYAKGMGSPAPTDEAPRRSGSGGTAGPPPAPRPFTSAAARPQRRRRGPRSRPHRTARRVRGRR